MYYAGRMQFRIPATINAEKKAATVFFTTMLDVDAFGTVDFEKAIKYYKQHGEISREALDAILTTVMILDAWTQIHNKINDDIYQRALLRLDVLRLCMASLQLPNADLDNEFTQKRVLNK
jgi:hypothetical protein